MGEIEERNRVDIIARQWIGTPFHDNAEIKGPQGGTDCARLLKCVFVEAGVIEDYIIPHYSPQFFLHSSEEKFLGYVTRHAREITKEEAKPGDVVVYKTGLCFAHGAIIVKPGWPHIVHAHYGARCVRRGFGTAVHLGTPIKDMKFFTRW
jgi:cell wall-associated NlpC family hydrolase